MHISVHMDKTKHYFLITPDLYDAATQNRTTAENRGEKHPAFRKKNMGKIFL